jgi:copper chaperone CopZ
VAALGTEKMKGVVEGYTRHFFTLAHCLVVNDREQPPRSLHIKMKELDKARKKGPRPPNPSASSGSSHSNGGGGSPATLAASMAMQPVADDLVKSLQADLTDGSLTPLERLHAAQRRQLAEAGGIGASLGGLSASLASASHASAGTTSFAPSSSLLPPVIPIKGRCLPGKIDLPGIVDAVTRQASQMVHRGAVGAGGGGPAFPPDPLPSSASSTSSSSSFPHLPNQIQPVYGDPNATPVVFVSGNGDIQIAMAVDGITCAHCVKIVETVLRGCNGNKSPIEGLLDAAADRALCSVLVRIDRASNARRIAHEAGRNLAMVGYAAKAKEMPIVGPGADRKSIADLGTLSTAFEVVAATDPKDFFDWSLPCSCPDNGIVRDDCPRYALNLVLSPAGTVKFLSNSPSPALSLDLPCL